MGLVAALNLYDADAHRFTKDICDQSLPSPNPLGQFGDSLLDYAQKINALHLNTIEAALVTSLVVMATGEWRETSRELRVTATVACRVCARAAFRSVVAWRDATVDGIKKTRICELRRIHNISYLFLIYYYPILLL